MNYLAPSKRFPNSENCETLDFMSFNQSQNCSTNVTIFPLISLRFYFLTRANFELYEKIKILTKIMFTEERDFSAWNLLFLDSVSYRRLDSKKMSNE
ncbi:uncharacterized protein LOC141534887 isoform X2 [Cotesia typhae]|uniref:uncharacterized protein LOC141534887 isoform X2 n=1 Tax=Cotesia typhae TaxID=2053667 RepID=UPI003D696B3A